MGTIIGIPGGWHGAWAFEPLVPLLAAHGLDLRPMTLKGMGEDYHPGVTGIGIEDHVKDLIRRAVTIADPITLLAWSYGGLVAAGALPIIRRHIEQIIFLDAIFPIPRRRMTANLIALHGEVPDWLKPWNKQVFRDVLKGRPVQPPPLAFFGVENTPHAQFVSDHLTPTPAAFRQGFTRFSVPTGVPMTFIRCTAGAEVTQRLITPFAVHAIMRQWQVREIHAPHEALITDTALVAAQIAATFATSRKVIPHAAQR